MLCASLFSTLPLNAQSTYTLELQDYVAAPITATPAPGKTTLLDGTSPDNYPYAARINYLKEDPANPNRLWMCDLNGPLYIFDKTTKQFHTILDFNGATIPGGRGGLYKRLNFQNGYAGGLVLFTFHPEYAQVGAPHYGVFYTVHAEEARAVLVASPYPDPSGNPGLHSGIDFSGYATQPVTADHPFTSGSTRHCILVEWTDTNPNDLVFTGKAREMLRTKITSRSHPLGDILFNPKATPGHPDYGNMYMTHGDGADGESSGARHLTPQRLDLFAGKILRIHPDDPDGSGPATYGIPTDNPFYNTPGARKEIWAYGFRNPHRFIWDLASDLLVVNDIGLDTWEEVNLVRPGVNYGWAEREGNEVLNSPLRTTRPLNWPADDAGKNYVYPVIQYPHAPQAGYGGFGDGISNGFVYYGSKWPQLHGQYLFGDITTGDLYWADFADMIAADDGNPFTVAKFNRFVIKWDSPLDADNDKETYNRLYEVVEEGYEHRGGTPNNLPGAATVSGQGRTDFRWATDGAGELLLITKTDGVIREVANFTATIIITNQPVSAVVRPAAEVTFTVAATGTPAPTYQWQRKGRKASNWTNVEDDSHYSGAQTAALVIRHAQVPNSGDSFRVIVTNSVSTVTSEEVTLAVNPHLGKNSGDSDE